VTSRVYVEPGAHRLEVKITEGDNIAHTGTLEINSVARNYWISGDRALTVREIPNAPKEGETP